MTLTCLDGNLSASPLVSAPLDHGKTCIHGCGVADTVSASECMSDPCTHTAEHTSDAKDLANVIVVQELLHARCTVQTPCQTHVPDDDVSRHGPDVAVARRSAAARGLTGQSSQRDPLHCRVSAKSSVSAEMLMLFLMMIPCE